jgi:hypothetical protein
VWRESGLAGSGWRTIEDGLGVGEVNERDGKSSLVVIVVQVQGTTPCAFNLIRFRKLSHNTNKSSNSHYH